jgi:hypothetical protein
VVDVDTYSGKGRLKRLFLGTVVLWREGAFRPRRKINRSVKSQPFLERVALYPGLGRAGGAASAGRTQGQARRRRARVRVRRQHVSAPLPDPRPGDGLRCSTCEQEALGRLRQGLVNFQLGRGAAIRREPDGRGCACVRRRDLYARGRRGWLERDQARHHEWQKREAGILWPGQEVKD